MPALNFKPQFVDPIREGRKKHTIRSNRKVPIKVGDQLFLYCGLRQKGAYRILPKPSTCNLVERISIEDLEELGYRITINGYVLAPDECEQLARSIALRR
jgi:hypothetical protein